MIRFGYKRKISYKIPGCLLSKEIVSRVSSSNNDSYSFFFCTTQTTSEQVAVKWSWTVVNWVPIIVSAFSMVFTPEEIKAYMSIDVDELR